MSFCQVRPVVGAARLLTLGEMHLQGGRGMFPFGLRDDESCHPAGRQLFWKKVVQDQSTDQLKEGDGWTWNQDERRCLPSTRCRCWLVPVSLLCTGWFPLSHTHPAPRFAWGGCRAEVLSVCPPGLCQACGWAAASLLHPQLCSWPGGGGKGGQAASLPLCKPGVRVGHQGCDCGPQWACHRRWNLLYLPPFFPPLFIIFCNASAKTPND